MTAATVPMVSADPRTRPRRQPHAFARVGALLRFIARRDRVRGPVWIVGVIGVVLAGTASVVGLYGTPADLASYASVAQADVATKALLGPGYGLDTPTQGAAVMNEMSTFTLIGVALMCIFMVVRHTRAEEETDRAELVRAAPVGRHAALVATTIWVSGITLALGIGVAVGMTLWLPVVGSIAFGAEIIGFGLVFVGVATVTAQVSASSRGATASGGIVLGAMFMVRAVGDLGGNWLTWASPLGWAQGIRAFAGERWWALIPPFLLAAVLISTSVALSSRRDLGHGLLTQRPGPPEGAPRLSTPLALAVRLQRPSVIGWTIGLGLMGFFMGIIANQADKLAENEAVAKILAQASGGSITESFLATIITMLALVTSGFVVSSALRLHSEERALRVSPILATPVSRSRWLWSHLTVALAGSALVMTATGLLTGMGNAIQVGNASEILPLIGASLARVPALWVLAGLAALLIGATPRLASMAWATVAFVAVVGLFGQSLNLPHWVRSISPFEHVPALPAEPFEVLPTAILLGIAAALMAVATIAIRHRDID